jgi:pSer/pThr/pTyr-binding forkhead associated (FHA) protein
MADLFLEIVEGREPGRQIALESPVEIGRDASSQVAVDDDQASRHHARVSVQGGQVVVEDLGSTNGTYVNDQPIAGGRPLQPGDRVRVGVTVFQLRTAQQVQFEPTAVRPSPQVTQLGHGVLQPVAQAELAPAGQVQAGPNAPSFAAEEAEPAFVPRELVDDVDARSDFQAIARLVDTSVKKQTNIAVIALLGAAGLAVLLAFGLK